MIRKIGIKYKEEYGREKDNKKKEFQDITDPSCHLLSHPVCCSVYSTLKMVTISSSETSVHFQPTTRRYILYESLVRCQSQTNSREENKVPNISQGVFRPTGTQTDTPDVRLHYRKLMNSKQLRRTTPRGSHIC